MSRPSETACLRDTFIDNSKCFAYLNPQEQQALMVYLKVKELAALGGTDYTNELTPDGQLNTDSIAYVKLTPPQVALSYLAIELDNATSAGATISTDINVLAQEIACLKNFDPADLTRMDLLVTCLLGRHAAYPQVNL